MQGASIIPFITAVICMIIRQGFPLQTPGLDYKNNPQLTNCRSIAVSRFPPSKRPTYFDDDDASISHVIPLSTR